MPKEERTSSLQVEIKPLEKSDIAKIQAILEAHVRNRETGQLISEEVEAIKGYMAGNIDEYGRIRTYLVAKDQAGKVLGCMAYSSPDPSMVKHFNLERPDNYIELLNAFVSPEVFRGGGVGRRLLNAICEAGKTENKQQLLIHSGPRYQDSWGFYDKVTDEQTGFIDHRYGEGRNAKTWRIHL